MYRSDVSITRQPRDFYPYSYKVQHTNNRYKIMDTQNTVNETEIKRPGPKRGLLGRPKKGLLKTGRLNTAERWAELIRERVASPHMQGWCASIIAWDMEDRTAFEALDPLMRQFSDDIAREMDNKELIEALNSIGYENTEIRVVLAEDDFRKKGVRQGPNHDFAIERTWSKRERGPSSYSLL